MRALTLEDSASLAALHATGFDRPWIAEDFQSFFYDGAEGMLYEENGVPLSFLLCRVLIDDAEILTLATAPEYRRRGIASALLDLQSQSLRQKGIVKLFLEVRADNLAAQDLYLKQNFEIIGTRKDYYTAADGTVCDAVTMLKFL